MDLPQSNKKEKMKMTKGQKKVLTLLIILVVMCIGIVIWLYILQNGDKKYDYNIEINGKGVPLTQLGVLYSEEGKQYVSINKVCEYVKYKFFDGEYNVGSERKDKCYIKNEDQIVQLFANSNSFYKTEENSYTGKQTYSLKNVILNLDNVLYISTEDIPKALNLIVTYSEQYNRTSISTPEYWIENNEEDMEQAGYEISDTIQNKKALSYGMVVVKSDGRYGVLNLQKQRIIGNKYNSMEFVEYAKQFIVSNTNNEYGMINPEGTTIIDPKYDGIEILNYEPLLYKVEKLGNCGIMKSDGTIIDKVRFSSIGYPADLNNGIEYTLIVPKLNENIPESIVVCQNDKYGLLVIETGEELLPCSFNGIFLYIDKEDLTQDYIVMKTDKTMDILSDYIQSLNSLTVKVNN